MQSLKMFGKKTKETLVHLVVKHLLNTKTNPKVLAAIDEQLSMLDHKSAIEVLNAIKVKISAQKESLAEVKYEFRDPLKIAFDSVYNDLRSSSDYNDLKKIDAVEEKLATNYIQNKLYVPEPADCEVFGTNPELEHKLALSYVENYKKWDHFTDNIDLFEESLRAKYQENSAFVPVITDNKILGIGAALEQKYAVNYLENYKTLQHYKAVKLKVEEIIVSKPIIKEPVQQTVPNL